MAIGERDRQPDEKLRLCKHRVSSPEPVYPAPDERYVGRRGRLGNLEALAKVATPATAV